MFVTAVAFQNQIGGYAVGERIKGGNMTHRTTQSIGSEPGVAIIDIWTFQMEVEPSPADHDLDGFSVEARDGKIGKVDEATHEAGGSFLIVDTGPWIFGKKVMLPAGVVERIDPESKAVFVDLTKDEIKNAPEYDEKTGRKDKDYLRRLGDYYRRR
jgi:hypothetical protein